MATPGLVSVVMPVRNGEAHIADQLAALAAQTYSGDWELVVSDNGGTDRSMAIVAEWAARLPAVRIADARARRGPCHARNAATALARGEYLAFCDADDVATPGWLDALVRAGEAADLVGGHLDFESLNDPLRRAWRPQPPMRQLLDEGFMPYAPACNMGVRRAVAAAVGWDEAFVFGSCDHDFSWRAQLAGYRVAYAPSAVMRKRHRESIRATAVQYYAYGRSGPQLCRAYRHLGMPAPDNADALRRWGRLLTGAPALWGGPERRGNWVRAAAFRAGRAVGSARTGVLCL